MRTVLLLLAAGLLAACASPGNATGDAPAEAPGLTVEIDRGDGSAVQRWTLSCGDPVSGDHPDAAAACAHLDGLDDPFAPLPEDRVCTEQYGGPQTARVRGTWNTEPVDLALSRVDGCAIAQWDSLGPLLPGPVGVTLPG